MILFPGVVRYLLGQVRLPDDYIDKYSVGKQIQVKYDRRQPSFAVLEFGSPSLAVVEFLLGAICLCLGIAFIVWTLLATLRASGATPQGGPDLPAAGP